VAPVGALTALPVLTVRHSRGPHHVGADALLTLGLLHLLEGHGRLRLRVQVLQVQRIFHVVHPARASHDVRQAVARHHQVVRLVDELRVLLHANTVHFGRGGRHRGTLERILLLKVVCGILLLWTTLAVRRWLDLHLEVGRLP